MLHIHFSLSQEVETRFFRGVLALWSHNQVVREREKSWGFYDLHILWISTLSLTHRWKWEKTISISPIEDVTTAFHFLNRGESRERERGSKNQVFPFFALSYVCTSRSSTWRERFWRCLNRSHACWWGEEWRKKNMPFSALSWPRAEWGALSEYFASRRETQVLIPHFLRLGPEENHESG